MDLIRFETRLQFSEETKVSTPAQLVFKALTGKESPQEGRAREPGVIIRSQEQKHAVRWNNNSCGVLYEDRPDHDYCIKNTITILDKINGIVPIGKLSQQRLIIFWILSVPNYDFQSLERKYREHFCKQSDIFDNCVDSSVIMDMKYDNYVLHHQSGAMDIDQLLESFKVFKTKEERPSLFIFLETSIESREMVEYSSGGVSEFLIKSFGSCKSHSTNFQREVEAIL